jgi:UDP-N-acetylmuramyl pentapeptide synthase
VLNKVFVDSDGLLRIWVVGDQSAASVREMGDKVQLCLADLSRRGLPLLILDDLRRMGHTDSAVRAEVARLVRQLQYDRAAMIGDGSLLMRYGTNLMLKAVGRSNARYFSHEETAVKWLLTGAAQLGARS